MACFNLHTLHCQRFSAGPSGVADKPTADDEDDCMIVEPKKTKKKTGSTTAVTAGVFSDANGKRKRGSDESAGIESDKRAKLSQSASSVITLD